MPRCHQRASPIECRRPGNPMESGSVIESSLAVYSGSVGTGFWTLNQSLPGVECRVQYSRGWSAMIVTPERMIGMSNSMFKKCCQPTHGGKPAPSSAPAGSTVPECSLRKSATPAVSRRPLATATAANSTTKPNGTSHSRFSQRSRPTRTRGTTPYWAGTPPAQVSSTTSWGFLESCSPNPPAADSGFGLLTACPVLRRCVGPRAAAARCWMSRAMARSTSRRESSGSHASRLRPPPSA